MPNNFSKTGTHYQSMDGDDINVGTDPNAPKRTPFDPAIGATVVISGDTTGAFNFSQRASTIIADGTTILRASGDLLLGNPALGSGNKVFGEAATGGNYPIYAKLNGNAFRVQILGGSATIKGLVFEDGVFENTLGSITSLSGCVFKDCDLNMLGTGSLSLDYCQLFNSSNVGGDLLRITNSSIDAGASIIMASWFSTPATDFINNNAQCVFTVGGTPYELKRDKSGSAIDPNPGTADIIAIDPTIYDRGNFSQPTEHLNLAKNDYWSVAQSSPNIAAGSDGVSNIGRIKYVVYKSTADLEFSSPDTLQDLVLSTGDYIYDIVAGTGFGFVLSDPYLISANAQPISGQTLAALLNFDSSAIIGTAANKDVPAVDNHAPGTAEANPRRITYLMRFSTGLTIPTVAGDYDNSGYAPAGSFFKFEHCLDGQNPPLVDVAGVGNGDRPTFNPVGAVKIAPRYAQIGIYVQEGVG